jgi:hypothetical protein
MKDPAAIEAEVKRQMAERPKPEPIEIEDEDEGRAVGLFLALDTQWSWMPSAIIGGSGGLPVRSGLRYEAIPPLAAALGITVDAVVMRDLQVMETAALTALAEARR